MAPVATDRLRSDLISMRGVWCDELTAFGPNGEALSWDDAGGTPGAFPYRNLVYVDFDGERYEQTNVVLDGRAFHQRSFTATVADGRLTFDRLGPDAPVHVGVSGGPGLIWFVAADVGAPGLQRYAEPDLIRIHGDRRWRDTVLWRNGTLARTLHVDGVRLTLDTTIVHELDPRGPGHPVHGERSVTTHYQEPPT
jgi:hypothetical protein